MSHKLRRIVSLLSLSAIIVSCPLKEVPLSPAARLVQAIQELAAQPHTSRPVTLSQAEADAVFKHILAQHQ